MQTLAQQTQPSGKGLPRTKVSASSPKVEAKRGSGRTRTQLGQG